MNGIHDMGGMDGFGPVLAEKNEPVFHADWERRVFAMVNAALRQAGVNVDEFRHAIERIPPARYLDSSYYERWLAAVEAMLVAHKVITHDELIAANQRSGSTDIGAIDNLLEVAAPPEEARAKKPRRAKFKIGDRVRARLMNPTGHTRLPRYVRGKNGVIVRDLGTFVFPDTNAHHAGENIQHCYAVVFEAREVWGKPARARERINVDLWEDYLEPAPKSRMAKRGKR